MRIAIPGAVLLFVFLCEGARAGSVGPFAPTVASSLASGGSPWVSPSAAVGSDDSRASSTTPSAAGNTDILLLGGFAISLPPNSNVVGVELWVEGHTGGSAFLPVVGARATLDGGISFPFIATASGGLVLLPAGPPDVSVPLGSALDTWGGSGPSPPPGIGAAEILNPAFAIGVQAADFGGSASDTYSIDSVALTVHTVPTVPGIGAGGALLCTGALVGLGYRAALRSTRS